MVPAADEAQNSNHKSNACLYAGLSSLYLVIFLIASFGNPIQFIIY